MPESEIARPTMEVDAELRAPGIDARIVLFAIPEPTAAVLALVGVALASRVGRRSAR